MPDVVLKKLSKLFLLLVITFCLALAGSTGLAQASVAPDAAAWGATTVSCSASTDRFNFAIYMEPDAAHTWIDGGFEWGNQRVAARVTFRGWESGHWGPWQAWSNRVNATVYNGGNKLVWGTPWLSAQGIFQVGVRYLWLNDNGTVSHYSNEYPLPGNSYYGSTGAYCNL